MKAYAILKKTFSEFELDYGLARSSFFIILYGLIYFPIGGIFFRSYHFLALWPPILAVIMLLLRPYILKLKSWFLVYFANVINILNFIIINYYLVGEYDRSYGGVPRWDQFLVDFDQRIYGRPVANIIEDFVMPLGIWGNLFYDLTAFAYLFYFAMPIVAGYSIYNALRADQKFRIGRYFSSILCFYALNYLLYLLFPVTGPQFFISDQFAPLALDQFATFATKVIAEGQPTFIDCFPSGHVGLTSLVAYWLFKTRNVFRYPAFVMVLLVIGATLAFRYHYTLDLICAIPLSMTAYGLAWFIFPLELSDEHLEVKGEAERAY